MGNKKRDLVGLKFQDRDAFGNFCETLAKHGVEFNHAGFYTIFIREADLTELLDNCDKLFQNFKKKDLVGALFPDSEPSQMRWPTQEETKKVLLDLDKKY